MRKIFVLTALAVLMLGACKKKDITPDNQGKDPEVEEVKDDLDFKLGFVYKEMVSTLLSKTNVWISIAITDTAPEPNILYRLKPIGNDLTKHQNFKQDYILKSFNKNGDFFNKLKEVDYIEVKDISDDPKLIIFPKVPGTFQLYFEMQKYDTVQKKDIGKPVVRPIAFSAVDIKFYTLTRNNPEKPKLRQRFYLFSIFDGNKANDKYLSDYDEVQGYTYKTSQPDGGGFTGVFSASKKKLINRMEFRHNDEQKKYDPPINHRERINIKIIKHLKNNNTVEIEYKNVWITEIETINP